MFEILISSLINTLRGKITEKIIYSIWKALCKLVVSLAHFLSWSVLQKQLIYFQIENLTLTWNYQLGP